MPPSEASQPCLSPRSRSLCFLTAFRMAPCECTGDPPGIYRQEIGVLLRTQPLLPTLGETSEPSPEGLPRSARLDFVHSAQGKDEAGVGPWQGGSVLHDGPSNTFIPRPADPHTDPKQALVPVHCLLELSGVQQKSTVIAEAHPQDLQPPGQSRKDK